MGKRVTAADTDPAMTGGVLPIEAWTGDGRFTHQWLDRSWGHQHVVTAGPMTGPAAVLVHGWPQHWFAWRHVLRALAPTTRLVAIDVRGFGWSSQHRGVVAPTIAELGDDIVATLADLDLDRPLLVGHDWGGWTGFRAVLDHPSAFGSYLALAIMAPWLDPPAMARAIGGWSYVFPMAAFGDRVARSPRGVRWLIDHSTTNRIWDDGDGAMALRSYTERIGRPETAAMTRHLYATLVRHELPAALRRHSGSVLVPTTMLVGEDETIAHPALYWPRTAPGGLRVETVPGARHWLAEEAPDAVVAAICRSLIAIA